MPQMQFYKPIYDPIFGVGVLQYISAQIWCPTMLNQQDKGFAD